MRTIIFVMACCLAVQAQQPTSQPKQDASNTALPNAPSAVKPLTAGGKLKVAALDAVNPLRILGAAVSAGIAQASDPYPEWGDGGEGYAKRFGAAVADEASGHIFKGFVFPALLRTDPRYFPQGAWQRRRAHRLRGDARLCDAERFRSPDLQCVGVPGRGIFSGAEHDLLSA